MAIPVEGGTVSLSIVDEERKLGINKLFDQQKLQPDERYAAILTRLLSNIGLSPALVPILIDWLDP